MIVKAQHLRLEDKIGNNKILKITTHTVYRAHFTSIGDNYLEFDHDEDVNIERKYTVCGELASGRALRWYDKRFEVVGITLIPCPGEEQRIRMIGYLNGEPYWTWGRLNDKYELW